MDIHAAGLARGPWQGTDPTATRVDGHNETCHGVGNVWFTSDHTWPGGTRHDVLAVRWGQEPVFLLNADALAWMAETTLRPAFQIRLVQALPWEQTLTAAELIAHLDAAGIRLNTQQRPQVWDALAIAAYHAQTGMPIVRWLLSDDANVYTWDHRRPRAVLGA